MNILNLFLLAVALGVDSFSLSLAVGAAFQKIAIKQILRLLLSFIICHFVMLLIGWFFGSIILKYIEPFNHFIILIFFIILGIKMIYEAIKGDNDEEIQANFFSIPSVLLLGIMTSLDALAVGFSFGMYYEGANVIFPNLMISVVVGVMTYIGLKLGNKLGEKVPKLAKILAGVVFILLGVLNVLEHYRFV